MGLENGDRIVSNGEQASFTTDYTTYSNMNEPAKPAIGVIPADTHLTMASICPMSNLQIYAYGVGHFLNDILAACWFNYLLLYLTLVNPIIPDDPQKATQVAGAVMLAGQVADAAATPIAGGLMDIFPSFLGMGKKRPFYILGTLLSAVSFFNIFTPCTLCKVFDNESLLLVYVNYTLWPVLFNIGWAMVQVAHMSMPPALSNSRKNRDRLNNLRNAFTFMANLSCFLIALTLFKFLKDAGMEYSYLSWICIGFGLFMCLLFMIGVPEKRLTLMSLGLREKMGEFLQGFKKENYTDQNELKQTLKVKNDFVEEYSPSKLSFLLRFDGIAKGHQTRTKMTKKKRRAFQCGTGSFDWSSTNTESFTCA